MILSIILYLLEQEAALYTTSFYKVFTAGQDIFIVINDITQFKGKDSIRLTEIIDKLERKQKYKTPLTVIPRLIVTITSNYI